MRHRTPSQRAHIISAAIICLVWTEFAPAQELFAPPPLYVGDEAVVARPEIPRLEPLPAIVPLPAVESSDTFTTSPLERSRELSNIRLSAAPPLGSPPVENPLHDVDDIDVADAVGAGRHEPKCVAWVPPALSHKPVYFEEVGAERYGQTRSPALQPVISGGKFLANAAILPYKLGVDSPHRVAYDVGLPRPGSPAPGVRETLPFSLKGMLYQGAASTGAAFFIHP